MSLPAGFTDSGVPVGIELLGRRLDDAALLGCAYSLEQADPIRRAPATTPELV
ncbi:MAG: hypothetical protein KA153_00690 [Hyphomonadaceae bacterium]|nr:hypothetical protein [Hyphomonadaceae bacterium]MBP9233655.1 hypothetical protein [Hyphomonadaceae bacterium]